jgi:hypothetical protein
MGEVVGPDIMDYYSAPLSPTPRTEDMYGGGVTAFQEPTQMAMQQFPPAGDVGSDFEPLPPIQTSVPQEQSSMLQSRSVGSNGQAQQNFTGAGFVPDLGQRRQSYFSNELARNPGLMQDLWTRANREVGSNAMNQQKWIETVANRAMFSGRSLDSVLNDDRYFPAISMRPTGRPIASDFSNVVSNVFAGGSNLTNLATDNASLDVARRRQQAGVTGEWMGAPGTAKEYFYRSNAGPYKTRAGLEASKYAQQLSSGVQPQQVEEQPQNGFSAALPQIPLQTQQAGSMQTAQQPTGQPQMVEAQATTPSRQEMESNGFLNTLGEVGSSVAGGVSQGIQNASQGQTQSPVVAAAQAGADVLQTILDPQARANSPLSKLFGGGEQQGGMGGMADTVRNLFGGDSAAENPRVNLGSMSPNASPNFNNTFANKLTYSDATGPTGDQADNSQPIFERLFGAI